MWWHYAASVCDCLCVSADLSLWLNSHVLAPKHVHLLSVVFFSSTWKIGGVWTCKLGVISQERLKIGVKLLLSANRKSYMPLWLAQRRMTLSDFEWSFHGSSVSSVWEARSLKELNLWCQYTIIIIIRIARYLCDSWASCLHLQCRLRVSVH